MALHGLRRGEGDDFCIAFAAEMDFVAPFGGWGTVSLTIERLEFVPSISKSFPIERTRCGDLPGENVPSSFDPKCRAISSKPR
jgi:hypothetical protein